MDFDALVDQYSTKIYNLAYRVTFNRADADDVVQETFLQVFKGLEDFRGDSSIGTWIYRIALTNALKVKKKVTKEFLESLDRYVEETKHDIPAEVQDWFTDPAKTLLLKELTNEIRYGCQQVMMQELPDTQKVVFILRVIFDFSYKDISEILQLPEDVIKSRLKRARATLSRHLREKCVWVREGGNERCCRSNIGIVLAQDTEILKRVYERVNENSESPEPASTLQKNYIDFIYKNLPQLPYDLKKLKNILP